jgi:hypothetical protein
VQQGLDDDDPWRGFRLVIEQLMAVHAQDRGFARAFTSRLPAAAELAAERNDTVRLLARLIHRAKQAQELRADVGVEDVVLVLMANEGIRAASPRQRVAASRRFAALAIESFRRRPDAAALPPSVRLPLGPPAASGGP